MTRNKHLFRIFCQNFLIMAPGSSRDRDPGQIIDGKDFKLRLWHLCTPCRVPPKKGNMQVDEALEQALRSDGCRCDAKSGPLLVNGTKFVY